MFDERGVVSSSFKVAGTIPNIDLRLSDKRLYQLVNHMQSIPFPESKAAPIQAPVADTEVCSIGFVVIRRKIDLRF